MELDVRSNSNHFVSQNVITKDDQTSAIDLLNDDCLLNIFSYLSIYDLINVRGVSHRLENLCDVTFRSYHRLSLKLRDLQDKLDYLDSIFLNIVIPNVYTLVMSGGAMINVNLRDQLLRHIPNCINLVQLELSYFRLDESQLRSFQTTFRNLKNLNLNRCEMDDNKMLQITELTQLTKLNLTGNTLLTGVHLPSIKSRLEELHLQFCTQIEFKYLAEYLMLNANQLLVLDISFDKQAFDEDLLAVIVKYQPNLKILNVGEIRIERFDSISKLKDLKSFLFQQLTTFSQRINVDELLEELSKSHLLKLLELDISFCELSPAGQMFLKKFECLELLRLKKLKSSDGKYDFLGSLMCLPTLKELDISFCNMGNEACLDIISKSPNLEVIMNFKSQF